MKPATGGYTHILEGEARKGYFTHYEELYLIGDCELDIWISWMRDKVTEWAEFAPEDIAEEKALRIFEVELEKASPEAYLSDLGFCEHWVHA